MQKEEPYFIGILYDIYNQYICIYIYVRLYQLHIHNQYIYICIYMYTHTKIIYGVDRDFKHGQFNMDQT